MRLQDWLAQGGDAEALRAVLQAAAQDPEVLVRELAFRELRRHDPEVWGRTLDAQLGSEDVDLRRSAVQLLAEAPDAGTLSRLRQATEAENVDVRAAAFEGLAQLSAAGGLDIIRERLVHPDPEVRLMALETLASQGGDYAMEAARVGLTDPDEEVRSKAEGLLDALRQP
jgi:HEAT repeat protein